MRDRLAKEMIRREQVQQARVTELQTFLGAVWGSDGLEKKKKENLLDQSTRSLEETLTHAIFTAAHRRKRLRRVLVEKEEELKREKVMRATDELPTKEVVEMFFSGKNEDRQEAQQALQKAQKDIADALDLLKGAQKT